MSIKETWSERIDRYIREGRTVSGGKGDKTAQAAEQSQEAFDNTLQQMMEKQYGQQQQVNQFLQKTLKPEITNPKGYTNAQLTSMRTQATDQLSEQAQQEQQALNNEENAKNGGSDLPSGVTSQMDEALLNQEAQAKANAQENITAENANLEQTNYWNAINALNGQEAQLNPLGYASTATSGTDAVANASEANTAASGPTFGSILGGVVGAGFGAVGSYFGAKGR